MRWLDLFFILTLGLTLTFAGQLPFLRNWPYAWLLLIIFPLWKRIRNLSLYPGTSLDLCLAFLILLLPITVLISPNPNLASQSATSLSFGFALFLCLNDDSRRLQNPLLLVWSISLLSVCFALFSLPTAAWKDEFRLFYLPLYDVLLSISQNAPDTIHANVLAGTLVVLTPVCFALALTLSSEKRGSLQRVTIWLISIISLLVLLLTQSRGGYLGFIAAVGTVITVTVSRWLLVLPITIGAGLFFAYRPGFMRLLEMASHSDSVGGLAVRLQIWNYSLAAVRDFPLTGIGLGGYTDTIPLMYPLPHLSELVPHAHNLYIQVALDLGLFGLIAYLAIIMNCFFMLWRLLRDRSDSVRWTLAVGAFASLVGMLTHGLFDAVLWGTKVAFVPWLLFALIVLLHESQITKERMHLHRAPN